VTKSCLYLLHGRDKLLRGSAEQQWPLSSGTKFFPAVNAVLADTNQAQRYF